MTQLPSAGRQGEPPAWPLPEDVGMLVAMERLEFKASEIRDRLNEDDRIPARSLAKLEREMDEYSTKARILRAQADQQAELEADLWRELWSTPQAQAWDALGWSRDVAQYVRHKVRAEAGSMDDAREARQWSDRLGLNPLAMLRLRWETERVDEAESRGQRRRRTPDSDGKAGPASAATGTDPRSLLFAVK